MKSLCYSAKSISNKKKFVWVKETCYTGILFIQLKWKCGIEFVFSYVVCYFVCDGMEETKCYFCLISVQIKQLKEKVEAEKGKDYPAGGQKLIYAGKFVSREAFL